MKKTGFIVVMAMLALTSFNSCEKEKVEMKNTSAIKGHTKTVSVSALTDGITAENGMLRFQSQDQIEQTINSLYEAYREHENEFLAAHPNMSGEELMSIEAQTNFNEYAPFEEFEAAFSYTSLRSVIRQQAIAYYEAGGDGPNNPEHHFVIEEAVRAVLNEQEEVKIGDAIYKFYEGGYVEIADGDFSKLQQIREDKNAASFLKNVKIEGNIFTTDAVAICDGFRSKNGAQVVGNNKKEWRVAIQTWPWDRYVIAETTNFQKKKGWNKIRCYTFCRVWGDISGTTTYPNGTMIADCSFAITFNTNSGSYSDSYNVKNWHHKISVSTRTQSGWVKGEHKSGIIGATFNSVLTF